MNANRALVVGSGMGALDVITRLLRPGDEVVTGDDLYGGTNRLRKYLSTNQSGGRRQDRQQQDGAGPARDAHQPAH